MEKYIPRPEHPNPQWRRESFVNLNGEWQFEIDANNSTVYLRCRNKTGRNTNSYAQR